MIVDGQFPNGEAHCQFCSEFTLVCGRSKVMVDYFLVFDFSVVTYHANESYMTWITFRTIEYCWWQIPDLNTGLALVRFD